MSPIAGIYHYHGNESRLGAGRRLVVAFDEGRKYISLLSTGSLTVVRVDKLEMRHAEPITDIPYNRLARRLTEKRRHFKRLGVRCSAKTVIAVVKQLQEQDL